MQKLQKQPYYFTTNQTKRILGTHFLFSIDMNTWTSPISTQKVRRTPLTDSQSNTNSHAITNPSSLPVRERFYWSDSDFPSPTVAFDTRKTLPRQLFSLSLSTSQIQPHIRPLSGRFRSIHDQKWNGRALITLWPNKSDLEWIEVWNFDSSKSSQPINFLRLKSSNPTHTSCNRLIWCPKTRNQYKGSAPLKSEQAY